MSMRKIISHLFILICFFALVNKNVNAQNLIPNGSFEQHYNCNYSNAQWVYPFDSAVIDWVDVLENTTDYFNTCNLDSSFRTPLNINGYQKAKEGDAYIGMVVYNKWITAPSNNNFRELIQSSLKKKLVVGKKYTFSMFVNLGDSIESNGGLGDYMLFACNNLGAYFTTWQYLLGSPSLTFPATHQINFKQIVTDTTNWVELKQSFIADSAYEFITIGNLNPYDSTQIDTIKIPAQVGTDPNAIAYYFIDDVSLVEDTTSGFGDVFDNSSKLLIYPNPVSNQLIVSSNQFEVNAIEVTNLLGQQQNVKVEKLTTEKCQLNTENLSSGIYFIKATDTFGNSLIGKFVKE
jgi:hypothetical protein